MATLSSTLSSKRFRRHRSGDIEGSEKVGEGNLPLAPSSFDAQLSTDAVVGYVDRLLFEALRARASDIHLEPHVRGVMVRVRVDGRLLPFSDIASGVAHAVVSRIKVLAAIDITEHRIPQEGRVTRRITGEVIDVRVVVLPTRYGEACVLRLHDERKNMMRLGDVGLDISILSGYRQAIERSHGVILVTGPTGAGKTTTVYATIAELVGPNRCVISVEDPIESSLSGTTQMQIQAKAGLTFPSALRAILRADPDIVVVGEIRDKETAAISLQAAVSGHLVLSTLHTHSAAATPIRLLEMGVAPYLVASALRGVLTQRLARRLCPHCKIATIATAAQRDSAAVAGLAKRVDETTTVPIFRPGGCARCTHSGYHGRIVVAEFLEITVDLGEMILTRPTIEALREAASRHGARSLIDDAWQAVRDGRTSLTEVARVLL
jgi:type II secretory ATPase GspE/PulE/Tfp pilus assembly ATPase PilB-like protein